MKLSYGSILLLLAPLLASCDQLGIETPAAEQARLEAEGKAIGSGCRQTGRPLEDCYQGNRKAPKAAIFTGWREMDAYMRENKIEDIKPELAPKPLAGASAAPASAAPATGEDGAAAEGKKPSQKEAVAGKDEKVAAKTPETPPAGKSKSAPTH
jgi:hypothetical protein